MLPIVEDIKEILSKAAADGTEATTKVIVYSGFVESFKTISKCLEDEAIRFSCAAAPATWPGEHVCRCRLDSLSHCCT